MKKEVDKDLPMVIRHICESWERKKGLKYPFRGGKHGKLLKWLCNHYEHSGVMALWDLFLNSDDPFFVKGGYSIEVFVTSIPKLADLGYKSVKQKYEQKLGFKTAGEILKGVGL